MSGSNLFIEDEEEDPELAPLFKPTGAAEVKPTEQISHLLTLLNLQLGASPGAVGDAVSGETPDDAGSEQYFSTGPSGFVIDDRAEAGEYRHVTWGFPAVMVNVRADLDIDLAFKKPHDNTHRLIPLDSDETPFNIGDGSRGVRATEMWIRKQTDSDPDGTAHVIAYR